MRYRRLADLIALLTLALMVGAESAAFAVTERGSTWDVVVQEIGAGTLLFVLGFGGVGWLLARRVPGNAVGWCFAVGGLLWATGAAGDAWSLLVQDTSRESAPLSRIVENIAVHSWIFSMPFSIQLPLLLLPNGRLLSPRWRPAVWLIGAGVAIGSFGFATIPGVIQDRDPSRTPLVNPLGLRGAAPLSEVLAVTGAGMLILGILAGAVALVLRFRRSRGVERQQMRWVAAGGCCVLLAPVGALVPGLPELLGGLIGTLGIVGVPVCVGVAVLRYRLYDLGRVVSRTLAYAVVTALLVGVYLGIVTATARLAPGSSSLAVAASTLAAAALFQPLRRRVQNVVDHRFNRARYDADRTVDDFRRRLRDEVDLDVVRADLLVVAQRTLQPESMTLWLRPQAVGPTTRPTA